MDQTIIRVFGCLGCYTVSTWGILDVPSGTSVDIVVYGSCDENGNLIEAETNLIPTGNNEYRIDYLDVWGNMTFATTVKFTATPLPGCDYVEPCDYYSGIPFNLHTVKKDNQWANYNHICDQTNYGKERLGFTQPITDKRHSDIYTDFDYSNVEICFDRQSQKLHFELNQDPEIRVLSDLCWDKIRDRYLHPNWIEIGSISEISTIYCGWKTDALRSIKGYYKYPPKLDAPPNRAFIFTEILLSHENSHVKHYNDDYVQWYIGTLYNWLKDWDRECTDFTTLRQAQESALSFAQGKVADYNNKILQFHYNWDGGIAFNKDGENIIPEDIAKQWHELNEQKTHDRKEVQDLINQYREAIINLCRN